MQCKRLWISFSLTKKFNPFLDLGFLASLQKFKKDSKMATLNENTREVLNQVMAITNSFSSALRAYLMSAHNGNDPKFDEFFSLDSIKDNVENLKNIILAQKQASKASASDSGSDSKAASPASDSVDSSAQNTDSKKG